MLKSLVTETLNLELGSRNSKLGTLNLEPGDRPPLGAMRFVFFRLTIDH